MFELSVACKYLIPRWRQLSVSIISIISVLVISLVVWLILVFFSVTDGLEKRWIEKLTSLTSPVRVTPTQAYYDSYYYHIDSISHNSDYTLKSIGEKRQTVQTDPYDPNFDQELPSDWSQPDRYTDGRLKDLVKEAFNSINEISTKYSLSANDYEITVGNLRLRLIRDGLNGSNSQTFLTQSSYLNSFDPNNTTLEKNILPPTGKDFSNLLRLLPLSNEYVRENVADPLSPLSREQFHVKINSFFQAIKIKKLSPKSQMWSLPASLIPHEGSLKAIAILRGSEIAHIILPNSTDKLLQYEQQFTTQGANFQKGLLSFSNKRLIWNQNTLLSPHIPLLVTGLKVIPAELNYSSLQSAEKLEDLNFHVIVHLQELTLKGDVGINQFDIAEVDSPSIVPEKLLYEPMWMQKFNYNGKSNMTLPKEGVLLAKSFRDNGVLLGDRGYLSYYTPTASSVQEQRIPVYVAGFYDPGIIPIGGRFITVNKEITTLIRSIHSGNESALDNGIHIRFEHLDDAESVKSALVAELQKRGIDSYWKVETFREYEFTKDLIQQLRSDKNLFSLIAMIIILVACSNIISMLIILVNDKKVEIGILRSMGATSLSIGAIFGLCGITMGLVGSLLGTLAAVLTLHNLDHLLSLLSSMQGFEVLNTAFYGSSIPQELSYHALSFVFATTVVISLLAGLIPAIKASLLHPSTVLRSE